jgi:hypothetical protein
MGLTVDNGGILLSPIPPAASLMPPPRPWDLAQGFLRCDVCRHVCNDDGFCRSRCFDSGDRLYMSDRDRDGYYHHRRPGVGFHVPGADVEIGR